MKRILILVFTVFAAWSALPAQAIEIINDGGFESGSLSSWMQWGAETVGSPIYAGDYSAHMTGGGFPTSFMGMNDLTGLLMQEINPEEGALRFDVSFSYQVENGGGGSSTANPSESDGLFFGIIAYDTILSSFGDFSFTIERFTPLWSVDLLSGLDGDGWQRFFQSFELPEGVNGNIYAGFWLKDQSPGHGSISVYVDDVSLSSTPVPEPGTLLLLGTGLLGLGLCYRKRIRNALLRCVATLG